MPVVQISASNPDRAVLHKAADLLRDGQLVAFPTETVYGLGAHALDATAVERIYLAKGRPAVNPVIVHVPNTAAARRLSRDWNDAADKLARAFWPGPLTLVVRKADDVPTIVTAGGDTVGIRVPSHPVALGLLEVAGIPVAAPSANIATHVSPTTAFHVARAFGDRVPLILDAGPTSVGIESTVVDVTGVTPRILRPGMISRENIAEVTGHAEAASRTGEELPRSPGTMGRHYAPRARLRLFDERSRASACGLAREASQQGQRVGAMVFRPLDLDGVVEHLMPPSPPEYARTLYATLHVLDQGECDLVLIERPPASPEWTAVLDRLERAAL